LHFDRCSCSGYSDSAIRFPGIETGAGLIGEQLTVAVIAIRILFQILEQLKGDILTFKITVKRYSCVSVSINQVIPAYAGMTVKHWLRFGGNQIFICVEEMSPPR